MEYVVRKDRNTTLLNSLVRPFPLYKSVSELKQMHSQMRNVLSVSMNLKFIWPMINVVNLENTILIISAPIYPTPIVKWQFQPMPMEIVWDVSKDLIYSVLNVVHLENIKMPLVLVLIILLPIVITKMMPIHVINVIRISSSTTYINMTIIKRISVVQWINTLIS